MNVANDRIIGKFREFDDALNDIAKQIAERGLATDKLSPRVGRQLQEMNRNSSRQSETFYMATPVQNSRLPETAFQGQAFSTMQHDWASAAPDASKRHR